MTARNLIIMAVFLGSTAGGAEAQERAIPLDRATACFALAQRLSDEDGGQLWGIHLHGPLLLVDARSREVVANQADERGWLAAQGGVWTGELPAELQPANTSLEWGGVRWTMVLWTSISSSPYEAGRLLMHESFHRIQPQLGFAASSPGNAHLDDESGRAWLRLEMRALSEAMIHDGERQMAAARHALLFRAARHELVGAAAAAEELALEANEGISEYTGLRLSGLPAAGQRQRLAMDLERREASANFTRAFAYATGPAWAFLLDELEPDWRSSAAANPHLSARVAQALDFQAPSGAQLVERATAMADANYRGGVVFEDERRRAASRAARLAELEALFPPHRGLRIETSAQFRYSFDPNSAESLDAQRIFYRPLTASDAWGTLSAPQGALIDFRTPMALVAPVAEGATPDTVPWRLELNAGYRLEAPLSGLWKIVKED